MYWKKCYRSTLMLKLWYTKKSFDCSFNSVSRGAVIRGESGQLADVSSLLGFIQYLMYCPPPPTPPPRTKLWALVCSCGGLSHQTIWPFLTRFKKIKIYKCLLHFCQTMVSIRGMVISPLTLIRTDKDEKITLLCLKAKCFKMFEVRKNLKKYLSYFQMC